MVFWNMAYGHINFIIILFNGQHEYHGHVGSGTEIGASFAITRPLYFSSAIAGILYRLPALHRRCCPFWYTIPKPEHIIAQMIRTAGAVFPNCLIFKIPHYNKCVCHRNRFVCFEANIITQLPAIFNFIK